ncbi:MAG: M23 family metallopeptidase [Bacteroidota bacterium]
MPKTRFHFDPHSLTFKQVTISVKQKLLKVVSLLGTGLAFSAVTLVILYNVVDSPKEKSLKREIAQYEFQLKLMNDRMKQLDVVLTDLQKRDDDIYRVVFEAEPVPASMRNAGYGGVNKYAKLEGFSSSDLLIEAMKNMDRMARRMYVQSKSYDAVYEMAKNKSKMLTCIPAIVPVPNGARNIASGFGYRIHPVYKTLRMHTGIDFMSPRGAKVYATGDGVVESASWEGGYGNCVIINHGYGYKTMYAHLSAFKSKTGQKVTRGEVVGYVGSTGLSVAPHLHYEVLKSNKRINPVNFFSNDLTPAEYQQVIEAASKVTQSMSL